jgi:hypothetical protein
MVAMITLPLNLALHTLRHTGQGFSVFGGHCAVFLCEQIHIQDWLGRLGVSNISAFYRTIYIHLTWKGFRIMDLAFGNHSLIDLVPMFYTLGNIHNIVTLFLSNPSLPFYDCCYSPS